MVYLEVRAFFSLRGFWATDISYQESFLSRWFRKRLWGQWPSHPNLLLKVDGCAARHAGVTGQERSKQRSFADAWKYPHLLEFKSVCYSNPKAHASGYCDFFFYIFLLLFLLFIFNLVGFGLGFLPVEIWRKINSIQWHRSWTLGLLPLK